MFTVDAIARRELVDGRHADVATHLAAEEIVEHAKTKRAADGIDAADIELRQCRGHDRKSGRQHRRAFGLQRNEAEAFDVSATHHAFFQPREAVRRDPGSGKAVLLQDFV